MNQEEIVLNHLKEGREVNKTIAINEMGIEHLNTKIFRLRDDGYDIQKTMKICEETEKNMAHYFLVPGRM